MNAKDLKSSPYAWSVSVLIGGAVSAALVYPIPLQITPFLLILPLTINSNSHGSLKKY